MALSLLPEKDVENYLFTFDLLQDVSGTGDIASPFCNIRITAHKGPPYPSPTMLLLKRKDSEAAPAYPAHIFCLLFDHYMFQVHVPFYKPDQWMYDGRQTISLIYVPPFLDKYFVADYVKPKATIMACHSAELVKGSIQDFSFSFGAYEEKIFDEFGNIVGVNTNS